MHPYALRLQLQTFFILAAISNVGYEAAGQCVNEWLLINGRGVADLGGSAVAVDEGRILVGAPFDDNSNGPNAGAVSAFTLINGVWTQGSMLSPNSLNGYDYFGQAIGIYGSYAVI